MNKKDRTYLQKVGTAWSQLWNAIWLGNPDQSFSSRSFEGMLLGIRGWKTSVRLIDLLFYIVLRQKEHCKISYLSDTERTYSDY